MGLNTKFEKGDVARFLTYQSVDQTSNSGVDVAVGNDPTGAEIGQILENLFTDVENLKLQINAGE